MGLRIEWLVLCERVIHDQQSGTLSLVGCLEKISALELPALHQGFAMAARARWDDAPSTDNSVKYRLIRIDGDNAEEQVIELGGAWRAGTTDGRIFVNFGFLRLRRVETLRFRLDFSVDGEPWRQGPAVSIDVALMDMPPERADAMRAALKKLQDENKP